MKPYSLLKFACLVVLGACSNTGVDDEAVSGDVVENPLPGIEPRADVKLQSFMGRPGAGKITFRTFHDREYLSATLSLSNCERGKMYVMEIDAGSSCETEASIGAPLFVVNGISAQCIDVSSVVSATQMAAKVTDWLIYGERAKSIIDRAVTIREDLGGGKTGAIYAWGVVTKGT